MLLLNKDKPVNEPKKELWEVHATLGSILNLTQHSALHRRYSVDAFHRRFGVPVMLSQYRLFQARNGKPLAFLAWAHLNDGDLEKAHAAEWDPVHFEDWKTGENLFFAEFLSVPGFVSRAVKEIRNGLFRKETATSLRVRVRQDGSVDAASVKVCKWRGSNFKGVGKVIGGLNGI